MVTQIKTLESDGYESIQVGYLNKKEKNITSPVEGHFKKANTNPKNTNSNTNKIINKINLN